MLKDFRDFINRGNVIDLAVAVAVGAAFGAITQSLVNDIVMPPIGLLLAGVDFNNMGLILTDAQNFASVPEAVAAGAPVLRYGAFLNTVINFLIVALVMFLVVRGYNQLRRRFQRQEEVSPGPPPAPSREEVLLAEIRDILAARRAGGNGSSSDETV